MSAAISSIDDSDRLLTFMFEDVRYALPIAHESIHVIVVDSLL